MNELPELPLDILIEIFRIVDSLNRRKLSLVSKEFDIVVNDCFPKNIIPFVSLDDFTAQFRFTTFTIHYFSWNMLIRREGLYGVSFSN